MKVHLIKHHFRAFESFLANSVDRESELYKYDIILNYNQKWKISEEPSSILQECLKSEVSRRIWRRENFDAKKMILAFANQQPDYTLQMFRDLYDETKAIDARVDRFKFYCDELFDIYKSDKPHSIETSHDQDSQMISLYLAGVYPEKYALYPGLEIFAKALKKFESPLPLLIDDLDRFFKACKAIFMLAQKEQGLWNVHEQRFKDQPNQGQFRQFSSEFILFVARSNF